MDCCRYHYCHCCEHHHREERGALSVIINSLGLKMWLSGEDAVSVAESTEGFDRLVIQVECRKEAEELARVITATEYPGGIPGNPYRYQPWYLYESCGNFVVHLYRTKTPYTLQGKAMIIQGILEYKKPGRYCYCYHYCQRRKSPHPLIKKCPPPGNPEIIGKKHFPWFW